ncbi:Aste57867_15935 [Aphanomyces stellatus]|uniref:Aste57867_15935 protein n=1 Tax=Aphanomyces stellatus TaxID=120398 RepID=A0A485L7F1_9STRA|nr:hypothetical protein As57867_015879 [Aphanomyces stellatus]VFT92721.1 Aste57867_15935 [Aphanomyces stellatus]
MDPQTPTNHAPAMSQEPYKAAVAVPAAAAEPLVVGKWSADLCACCDHIVPNCLCSCCCPCITLGQIVARLGIGDCFVTGAVTFVLGFTGLGALLVWLYTWYLRGKFRFFFSIPGSPVEDCLVTFFCGCCVLAQMATHVGSYTPGECSFEAKSTLPGYSSMLASNATPLAVPVPEPSQV